MRKLIASAFASLDGIMQAPGGPEEDPAVVYAFGGWMFSYADESMDFSAAGFDGKDRELVLGRRTYQIFEAYWPYQPDDHPIAKTLQCSEKACRFAHGDDALTGTTRPCSTAMSSRRSSL